MNSMNTTHKNTNNIHGWAQLASVDRPSADQASVAAPVCRGAGAQQEIASKSLENSGLKGGRLGGRRLAAGGHPLFVFVVSVSCLPTPVCRRKELEFLRHSVPCPLAIPLHFARPDRISRAADATLWLEGKDHVHASAVLPATPTKPLGLPLASTTAREAKQTAPSFVCCLLWVCAVGYAPSDKTTSDCGIHNTATATCSNPSSPCAPKASPPCLLFVVRYAPAKRWA